MNSTGEYAGWHVILGDNGSGKSTVLQSMALAFVGRASQALRQNWDDWLPHNRDIGKIQLWIDLDKDFDIPFQPLLPGFEEITKLLSLDITRYNISGEKYRQTFIRSNEKREDTYDRYKGRFSTAYGPFRRFTGGSYEYQRIYRQKSMSKLAAHLSIFGEDIALTEALEWLQQLDYKRLDLRSESEILEKIIQFINQPDLLPYDVQLTSVSSDGVIFNDANGNEIPVENLSDGYRSILSMTFEMIRQMQIAYDTDDLFSGDFTQVIMPGVVLIDEVDAHLHPTWQRRVGKWFREHFPNIQFIVTTHSPLVCQAAEVGSVWKLPRPGSDEEFYRVEGQELDRLLYGDILEAYSTKLFELPTTRSESAKEKLEQLAELNVKEIFGELSDEEREKQSQLRAMLPTDAGTTKVSE